MSTTGTRAATRVVASLISVALLVTGLVAGTPLASAETTTLISETFEGTYPPAGWNIEHEDLTSDGIPDGWERVDGCDLGFGRCIQTTGSGARAFMPTFDTTGLINPTLSFNIRIVDPPEGIVNINILDNGPSSLDGLTVGGQYVGGIYPDTSPSSSVTAGNNAVSIPLATNMEYILRFSSTVIAPPSGPAGLIQLDNIQVQGTAAAPPPPPVNNIPVAHSGTGTVDEDTPATFPMTGTDGDGHLLTYSIVSQPANGTLTFNGGHASSVFYTPKKNFVGTDSFQFRVTDTGGLKSDPATFAITVEPVNDAPVVSMPEEEFTGQGQPIYFIGKNQITISDVDAGTSEVQMRMFSSAAPISMQHKGGLTFTTGDGTADNEIVATGTIADLNAALNGVFWSPARTLTGDQRMSIQVDDLGNAGKGGAKTGEGVTEIEIRSGPDASIGNKGRPISFVGLDFYGIDATEQTLNSDVHPRRSAPPRLIEARVRNVGLTTQTFTMSLGTVGDLVAYRAFDDFGDDVTAALDAGTYEVEVAPGGVRSVELRVSLLNPSSDPNASQRLTITTRGPTATNVPNPPPAPIDVVAVDLKVRQHVPDVLVSDTSAQFNALGNNVYTQVPSGHQTLDLGAIRPLSGDSFYVWIQNDSLVEDTIHVSGISTRDTDVDIHYYDDRDQDITAQVESETYSIPDMPPGSARRMRVSIIPKEDAVAGPIEVEIYAYGKDDDVIDHDTKDVATVSGDVAGDLQPDLFIFSEQDPDRRLYGWEVIERDVARYAVVREDAEVGAVNHYEVFMGNTTGSTGIFSLDASFKDAQGFTARFFTDPDDPASEITSAVLSGTHRVELKPLHQTRVYVQITATDSQVLRSGTLYLTGRAVNGLPKNIDRGSIELISQLYQPDVQVAANQRNTYSNAVLTGGDVYGLNGGNQMATFTAGAGESIPYLFRISDDSMSRSGNLLTVRGSGDSDGYTVRYFSNFGTVIQQEITSAVVDGTYSFTPPGKGDLYGRFITALVTAPSDVPPSSFTGFLTAEAAISRAVPKKSDTVAFRFVSAYRPDIAVVAPGGLQTGRAVTNRTGEGQAATHDADIGTPYRSQFIVWNAGSTPDSFQVTLAAPANTKGSLSENATASPVLTFTTPVVQPGQSAVVPFRAVLPSRTRTGALFDFTATVTSVTRPAAVNDVAKLTLKGKVTCSTPPISFDNVRVSGECIQVTDDGWLLSRNATLNGLDLAFGTNVAFLDRNAKTLSVDNVSIELANTDTKIYAGPLNDMALNRAATINGSGTTSQVYGMVIGPGMVEIDTSKNPAGVKLPLRPLAVFSGGQPSAPLSIPTTGGTGTPGTQVTVTWPSLRLETLNLADVTTVYDPATRRWIGYGRVGLPHLQALPGLEMALSSGGGSLDFGFIKLTVPAAQAAGGRFKGVPIGSALMLREFEAAVDARDGFSIYGTVAADVTATTVPLPVLGPTALLQIRGKFAYTNRESPAKFTLAGQGSLAGLLTFADFAVTYAFDGSVRMTGTINHSIDLGFGSIGTVTTLDGAANSQGKFQLEGDGRACVVGICAGINGIVSSKGIAACGSIKVIRTYGIGFGMKWKDASLAAFFGCNLDDYKDLAAPTHVDFAALSSRTNQLLAQADNVRQLITAVSGTIQNAGGPAF